MKEWTLVRMSEKQLIYSIDRAHEIVVQANALIESSEQEDKDFLDRILAMFEVPFQIFSHTHKKSPLDEIYISSFVNLQDEFDEELKVAQNELKKLNADTEKQAKRLADLQKTVVILMYHLMELGC